VRTAAKLRQVGFAHQEHAVAQQAAIDRQAHRQKVLFQFRRSGAGEDVDATIRHQQFLRDALRRHDVRGLVQVERPETRHGLFHRHAQHGPVVFVAAVDVVQAGERIDQAGRRKAA
jgi:hypothetical protein